MQLLRIGLPLCVADLCAVFTGAIFAYLAVLTLGRQINHFLPFMTGLALTNAMCLWMSGLYPGLGWHPARELKQLFRGSATAALVVAVGLLLFSSSRSSYVLMTALALPVQLAFLPAVRYAAKRLMRQFDLGVPVFFMGRRADVMRIYRDMNRFGWTMLKPVGRFAPLESNFSEDSLLNDNYQRRFEQQAVYLGTPELAPALAAEQGVYCLVIVSDNVESMLDGDHHAVLASFPQVTTIRCSRSLACAGTTISNFGLASGVRVEESLLLPGPRLIKRLVDVLVASLTLLVLSPVIAVIALLIKLTSTGPIFFSHKRIGQDGRTIHAWKFRSMVSNARDVLEQYLEDHPELRQEWERDHKLKDDPRITTVGRVLRKTSLDELPQLWNVLVGEMSLVGPRPIVEAEIAKYGNTFRDYLRVPPGITGLWQISGRNNTTYAERLAYDEFYVRHWSPWLDLYILLRTVRTVVFCEGAY